MNIETTNFENYTPDEYRNNLLRLGAVSSSVSLPKQKRVMFKFDDDEPMHLNSIFDDGEFIIKLKEINTKLDELKANEFEDDEKVAKREYGYGFRRCYFWLKYQRGN